MLESINSEAAGVESGAAVRCADGDEHASLADFQTAKAVNHGHAMDGKFLVELRADFAHFRERHGFVSFVVEVKSWAIVRLVADEAVEGDGRAIFGCADVEGEGGLVNRLAHQPVDVFMKRRGHGDASAATHGREKCDFIAGMERRIPGGEFLVAGSDERGTEFGEIGMACDALREELLDRRGISQLDIFLRATNNFFQPAKEEHFYADCL